MPRKHVFCLQAADGAVWLFQTTSFVTLLEWVSSCNYWAAALSKEPLPGGVCNIDYGWGSSSTVTEWTAPAPCMIASTLELHQQLAALESWTLRLTKELEEHRQLKTKVENRVSTHHFPFLESYSRVFFPLLADN